MVIYCTTNLVNGKKYIGKDQGRWSTYLGSGILLKKAIEKYGKRNFVKEILQECSNVTQLNEAEIYWIEYFGAVRSDLFYNQSEGGTGGDLGLEVRLKQSISAKRRVSEGRGNSFQKGVGSKPYASKISKAKLGVPQLHKRVKFIQLNLDDSIVEEWNGFRTAGLALKINPSCIRRVCEGQFKTYKGFKWKLI